jgi:hypothetical protein
MNPFRLILALALITVCTAAFGQVDETKPSQDTLVIIEEEVLYDTLYLYEGQIEPELMSKEELLEAFRRDRGIGRLYYDHGHMNITGTDGEMYKLNNADLKWLLPSDDYTTYRKAKRDSYISIPLYVIGGTAVVFAGIGFYQFCAAFVQTAKANDHLLNNDNLGLDIWRSAMGGLFLFGGSALAATAFMVPAVVLTIKSKVHINSIIDNFNAPSTVLKLSFAPTPGGAGVVFQF